MCGIFAYLHSDTKLPIADLFQLFQNTKSRGPDKSTFTDYHDYNMIIGFHRLSIMDISQKGSQPFYYETDDRIVFVICNGEIYNFKELLCKYDIVPNSGSDCEVLLPLYLKTDIKTVLADIKGEFAFAIFDIDKKTNNILVYCARDPFGIKPLFVAYDNDTSEFMLASELKSLYKFNNLFPVPVGNYMSLSRINGKLTFFSFDQYHSVFDSPSSLDNIHLCKTNIVSVLENTVNSYMCADRQIGCLLSGGIDSSVISALAAKYLHLHGKKLKTFCVGMSGSTDKDYAQAVADHIHSDHTYIEFPENVWLDAIRKIVYITETYDVTTIRASTGQYLVSKWISENTDIKVLLIGDGADELFGSYLYFHNSPSPKAYSDEVKKLLYEISYYDVLRVDRCVSANGLEARVPYLDTTFVNTYLSVIPELRMPQLINNKYVEKWLFREAFADTGLLPECVLSRKKEAFSDGVSSQSKSWYTIIQQETETKYSDEQFIISSSNYSYNPPQTKEALYYRHIFESYFGEQCSHVIPHYWMPNWVSDKIKDPSARVLDVY